MTRFIRLVGERPAAELTRPPHARGGAECLPTIVAAVIAIVTLCAAAWGWL